MCVYVYEWTWTRPNAHDELEWVRMCVVNNKISLRIEMALLVPRTSIVDERILMKYLLHEIAHIHFYQCWNKQIIRSNNNFYSYACNNISKTYISLWIFNIYANLQKKFDFTMKKTSANTIESPIYYSHFTRPKSFAYDMDFTISFKKKILNIPFMN